MSLVSSSDGVMNPRVLRGRLFIEAWTRSSSARSWTDRSVPLGKYWRSSPLVFSLVLQGFGQGAHHPDHLVADADRVVTIGQVQQQQEPCRSLDEGADR